MQNVLKLMSFVGTDENVRVIRQENPSEQIVAFSFEELERTVDERRDRGFAEVARSEANVQAGIDPTAVEADDLAFERKPFVLVASHGELTF